MNTHQQIKGILAIDGNHDFTVQDKLFCLDAADDIDQFRKISRHRFAALRLKLDIVS